ncbi:MAG: zf-TFIIB domain-containing protein [Bacteroidia bacterium]
MAWFKKKAVCVHCNTNKTRREFEGSPICPECEIEIRMGREEIRNCPIDGQEMLKEQYQEIIIDRCPRCKGVWLDGGELQALKESGDEEMAAGMVMGMMMD